MINLGRESEYVEFKKSTNELNEAMASISSMLNKNGKGTIYFGVRNNGDAIGQQISDSTLRDISRKIHEDIKPDIYPSIHEMENSPGVIAVEFSGNDKPYSAKGLFYIRVSDEDRKIDIHELIRMINKSDSSNSVWEKEETSEDLDGVDDELLSNYVKKANECGRIKEEYGDKKTVLQKLGLLNGVHLNNAGRILFSKNKPLALKLAVFATDAKLSFIDVQRFEGNLFELSKKGQDYIKEHINYSAKIVGAKRVEIPEIPLEAIREAVLNSLCHSSFDSTVQNEIYITPTKVVIFNPGSFPFGYEPKDFAYNGVESVLRNPLISKVLYYSNDIDSWATGFRRIFTCCNEADVKVSYMMRNQGFELCFYRNGGIQNLTTKDLVFDAIKNDPNTTIEKLSDSLKKSRRTIQLVMTELKEEGRLVRVGANKTGYWETKDL